MKRAEIEQHVGFWQEALGLQSWKLTVKITPAHDMDGHGQMGSMEVHHAHEAATMQIVPKAQWAADERQDPERDEEEIIVHELLHLRLAGMYAAVGNNTLDDPRWFNIAEEAAINRLAPLLVMLRRAAQPVSKGKRNERD